MSTAKKEPGLAMLVIVLALICLVVAALLGLVNQVTAPAIAANTEKTIQDSLKVVLPADSYEKVEYDGGDITLDTGTVVPVLAVYQAGEEGYVVETNSPNGFGGAIDMMAGINSAGEVTGLAIMQVCPSGGIKNITKAFRSAAKRRLRSGLTAWRASIPIRNSRFPLPPSPKGSRFHFFRKN